MRKNTLGLAPGTLIASQKAVPTQIKVLVYNKDQCTEKVVKNVDDLKKIGDPQSTTWIQIQGLGDIEKIKALGELFEINALVLEDILNRNHRPKVEFFGDYDFINVKYSTSERKTLHTQQISIIRIDNVVISFQSTHESVFEKLEQRFSKKQSRLQKHGDKYLTYAILDFVIDQYILVQEYFEESIEALSHEIHVSANEKTREKLYLIRKQLLSFQHAVIPLLGLVDQLLQHPDYTDGRTSIKIYLQDLRDHVLHIQDVVRTYTGMLEGLSSLYFSITAERTNKVMQVLTMVTIIFLPLTLLAGIYGMNFQYMPELHWKLGYPLLLVLMLCVVGGILYLFKRKKWL